MSREAERWRVAVPLKAYRDAKRVGVKTGADVPTGIGKRSRCAQTVGVVRVERAPEDVADQARTLNIGSFSVRQNRAVDAVVAQGELGLSNFSYKGSAVPKVLLLLVHARFY